MATTTTVCVVAKNARELVEATAGLATNVAAEVARSAADADVWRRAHRRSAVYTLVDVDPLAPVVVEWAKRLDGEDHDLETAIGVAPRGPAPDYYFVSDALEGTKVHWYLGLLVDAAPARVMTVRERVDDVLAALRSRRTGPSLPDLAEVASRARSYVPTALSGAPAPPGLDLGGAPGGLGLGSEKDPVIEGRHANE